MAATDDLRANLRAWLAEQPGVTDVRDAAGSPEVIWADLDGQPIYIDAGPFVGV